MRPFLAFASLLAAAFLSSCATAYQRDGLMGGFSETQLAENVYRVRFNGNGYTSLERASDFALLRSAELCLRTGYAYFIIEDAEASEKRSEYRTPTHTQAQAQGHLIGDSAYVTGQSTTYGGQTHVITKPGHSMLVVFFRTPPKNLGLVYQARFIDSSLRDKYGLR